MKITVVLVMMLSMQVFAISVHAAATLTGDAIARQGNGNGAPPCMSCHGDKGQGVPAVGRPYLAGQSKTYLVKQLTDFLNKRRSNSVMQPIASALTAQEINAVATYYSRLPLRAAPNKQKNGAQGTIGESLASKGKWSVGMPACFKCHGDKGQGIAPNFPAISGQSSKYLKAQLEHWQKGERSNDPVGLMQAVVEHLNDAEIAAVTKYISAQSPAKAK